jgi:hypothetical protein
MLFNFDVKVGPSGSPTTLTNVQTVNVNAGRRAQIDNFTATTCTIVCRYPTGYASPVTAAVPGARLAITMAETGTGSYFTEIFVGKVTDVSVEYGIPYQSGVGNADYLTITGEGALAELARTSGNGYAMAANTVESQLVTASTQSGVFVVPVDSTTFSGKSASAATVSGSWADWLNQMAFTFAGRIGDLEAATLSGYAPIGVYTTSTAHFSDVPGAQTIAYNNVTFDSIAQNYFTQITVDPDAYAPQIASSGSAPYRNFTINTWSSSTGTATDLANYYLNLYNAPALAVSSIHVYIDEAKAAAGFDSMLTLANSQGFHLGVGLQVPIVFRGQTYTCVIEGAALSATPSRVSWTLYVSGAILNDYLIFNNAVLGTLDNNRLGF